MNHMYEHKKQPLASAQKFRARVLNNLIVASVSLSLFLTIGVFGYHFLAGALWIDAFHNAAMILSGMGPVIEIPTDAGKIFSSIYAIFSGILFISMIGFILTPVVHRAFHRFHLEDR